MEFLNDDMLLEAYILSVKLELDEEFIELLANEIILRELFWVDV